MTGRDDPRQEIADAIMALDTAWTRPSETIEIGDVRWLPDLAHTDGRLLHIAFEEIAAPWLRRLQAAHGAGYSLTVACLPAALGLKTLVSMQAFDGRPLLIDYGDSETFEIKEYTSVADLVALNELDLGQDGLQTLATPLLERALIAPSAYDRGLYFEQVLCLLFSQAAYLRVISHRYTNETEEIDLVLGNRAVGELHGLIGGPLVLVSAKNQAQATGAGDLRALRSNMSNRRGRCRLGILCTARELASTISTEQIRTTTDPFLAVAVLDGDAIKSLLQSTRLDEHLADHLLKAVMD